MYLELCLQEVIASETAAQKDTQHQRCDGCDALAAYIKHW